MLLAVCVMAGLGAWAPAAQAADTGNPAPQNGRVVSDEPGQNTPNILDGTVYSITKVGNYVIVGGQFTSVNNGSGTPTFTRRNVLAFDASSGKILPAFAPDPNSTVYKVLPAADGKSVYVAGGFTSAGGQSMPGRLFKINVTTGVIDPNFNAVAMPGDIRDLELVGHHLFVAGKFTNINGVVQKALGTVNADTGARDPYFNAVLAGLHNPGLAGAITDVLQISVNPQNTQLMAVGNFMTVDGQARVQIAKFDISNLPAAVQATNDPNQVHQTLNPWSTTLYQSACSPKFETNMTDVEYSQDGSYFIVSTTGAYGGSGSNNGNSGCDVVTRFENTSTPSSTATWTSYTGGDTTWTVEVTNNIVYAGGHMRWFNNPGAGDAAGPGAVSREGIAALDVTNGMPVAWNPTRARGVGIQDMLATSDGLYVGSDTTLIGHTAGNTYHARIAFMPLAGGEVLPQVQSNSLPVDVYKVATGATQLVKRSFTGTTAGTQTNVATGPGWGTATGAFMANGNLYKANSDGTLSEMSFDGTTYGTATTVNTADAIVPQTDWHTDVKTITNLFYSAGYIYYTKSGTNALYRRAFELDDNVVGQQRFSTTSSSVNWSTNVKGAFVAGGKLYYSTSTGALASLNWSDATHNVSGTSTTISGAGTGWASRAMFPMQGVPAAQNQPPTASAAVSCNGKVCSFDGTGSADPEGGALSYDWDFGDGSAHGTGATTTHTYADSGDRAVTLTVTDNKGATASTTRTASPSDSTDPISFVGARNNNGSRSSHTITTPTGTQVGDQLLLFIAGNSTTPTYNGPAGWTPVLNESGSSFDGLMWTKKATAGDIGTPITVTSTNPADGTAYVVKSDLTVAAYRGVGTPAINVAASTSQSFSSATHQTPTLDDPDGVSWLVSYWSDKSTTANGTATNWTGPTSQTQRSESTASGSSHMSSLLTDSNARVGKGVEGGLNATADSSNQGLTMSVLLSPAGAAPANQPPTATSSTTSCANLTCSFDGSLSTDPEGGPLTYDWSFGDGSPDSTSATPTHTFPAGGGSYQVVLTVKDNQGATSSATPLSVTTTDPPADQAPTAVITNASCSGQTCSADGSKSSDPDAGDTITYDWNWGDGSAHDTTANPQHHYTGAGAVGPQTITLTVSDGQKTGSTSTQVTTTADPDQNPTAHITNATCNGETCSFTSSASDPDGDTLTYSWDFGDNGATSTQPNPSYTYSDTNQHTVTLTVSDGRGGTGTDTTTVTPSAAPASNVVFVGAASGKGTATTATATLPTGVHVGDTMVAFFTVNSNTPTYSMPTGWTQLQSKAGNTIATAVWTKTATSADTAANAKATVTLSSSAKSDVTVGVYRGTDGTTPIVASAATTDNGGATHVSPTVTATDSTSWLVSYWADKANDTTGWTAPASQTVRANAATTAGSSAHITSLLTDSNGPVPAGSAGGLTATANSASGKGASISVLLKSS